MDKGSPVRMHLVVCVAIAALFALMAAPAAFAQSPEDIPGFEELPIPGGEDPAEDPGDGPADDPADDPQVDFPGGGVDTGAGGMAGEDGGGVALATAGALAVMGGATLVARRRSVRG